jgi:hypothetical protein
MNFTEAVAHFNNSRRKMAYALDLSIQAVQNWAKNPEKPIPNKRAEQIEEVLIKRRQAETIPQAKE